MLQFKPSCLDTLGLFEPQLAQTNSNPWIQTGPMASLDAEQSRAPGSGALSAVAPCNTPDVTFHICNSNSCHFRLCVMIFPPWLGFVFRFAFYSCHAFQIMSSCASHLHTCSSHAFEHFPHCPFCNPVLLCPSASPFCLSFCILFMSCISYHVIMCIAFAYVFV